MNKIEELSVSEIEEVDGGRMIVYLAFEYLSLSSAFAVLGWANY